VRLPKGVLLFTAALISSAVLLYTYW